MRTMEMKTMTKPNCLIGGSVLALGLLAWSVPLTLPATVKAADTVLINGAGATFPNPIYAKWFRLTHVGAHVFSAPYVLPIRLCLLFL